MFWNFLEFLQIQIFKKIPIFSKFKNLIIQRIKIYHSEKRNYLNSIIFYDNKLAY
jgi:hypothetical protein